MPLNPTPIRQKIRTFLTPLVSDLLIAQTVDISRLTIPEYGTPHPDKNKYPDHVFCYATAMDDQGLIDTFLYVAKRDKQDNYCFEYRRIEVAGVEYDAVTRTYITPRAEFNPDVPAINSAMPNVPKDKFPGTYLLFEREQVRTEMKELDSLFVTERQTFIDFTGGQQKIIGQDSLIPAKFRSQVTTKETRTLEPIATVPSGDLIPDPPTPTGNQTKIVIDKRNDDQFFRIVTEEVISGGAALSGRVAYVERNSATTNESVVPDGTSESTGLQIVDSRVTPLGNGKSIKETTTADAWPIHTGSRWNEELGTQILFTEQFVAPGQGLSTPYTDVSIVNKDRNLRHTEVIPTPALNTYHLVSPYRVSLPDLPRELISVNVVWNEQYSIGTQDYAFIKSATGRSWSLSASADDSASSSASLQADIQLKFRDIASSNLAGTKHKFYIQAPVTQAKILAKLGAKMWPVFKPESTTITASGQSVRISVSAQASLSGTVSDNVLVEAGWSKGTSDDFSISLSQNSIQIPACIHPALAITGVTSRSQLVSATALIGMTNTTVGTVTSTRTKTGTAVGLVTPTLLAATGTVTTIPRSGLYLLDSDVADPQWGWSKVTAIVFDASVLA